MQLWCTESSNSSCFPSPKRACVVLGTSQHPNPLLNFEELSFSVPFPYPCPFSCKLGLQFEKVLILNKSWLLRRVPGQYSTHWTKGRYSAPYEPPSSYQVKFPSFTSTRKVERTPWKQHNPQHKKLNPHQSLSTRTQPPPPQLKGTKSEESSPNLN